MLFRSVALPANIGDANDREVVKRLFDEAHQVRYSHSAPEESADVVSLRVTAIGRLVKPELPSIATGGVTPVEAARRPSRRVTFAESEPVETAVYDRERLLSGNVIQGPAVIEEASSTTILEPGDTATVNQYGHLVIHVA